MAPVVVAPPAPAAMVAAGPAGYWFGRGLGLIHITIVFSLVSFFCLFVRSTVRVRAPGRMLLTDWVLVVAWLCAVALAGCNVVCVLHGYGKPMRAIVPEDARQALRAFWIAQIVYKASINLTKVSFLLLYIQIWSDQKRVIRCCYWLMAFVGLYALMSITIGIMQCLPLARAWNRRLPGACIAATNFYYANGVYNILTDVTIFIIPLCLYKTYAQGPRPKVIGLVVCFSLGFFTCVTSILRLTQIYEGSKDRDVTSGTYQPTIWTTIESNTAIICACLPQFAPLIEAFWKRLIVPAFGPVVRPTYQYILNPILGPIARPVFYYFLRPIYMATINRLLDAWMPRNRGSRRWSLQRLQEFDFTQNGNSTIGNPSNGSPNVHRSSRQQLSRGPTPRPSQRSLLGPDDPPSLRRPYRPQPARKLSFGLFRRKTGPARGYDPENHEYLRDRHINRARADRASERTKNGTNQRSISLRRLSAQAAPMATTDPEVIVPAPETPTSSDETMKPAMKPARKPIHTVSLSPYATFIHPVDTASEGTSATTPRSSKLRIFPSTAPGRAIIPGEQVNPLTQPASAPPSIPLPASPPVLPPSATRPSVGALLHTPRTPRASVTSVASVETIIPAKNPARALASATTPTSNSSGQTASHSPHTPRTSIASVETVIPIKNPARAFRSATTPTSVASAESVFSPRTPRSSFASVETVIRAPTTPTPARASVASIESIIPTPLTPKKNSNRQDEEAMMPAPLTPRKKSNASVQISPVQAATSPKGKEKA